MSTDDFIRRFLSLHPDTPIDNAEYGLPLRAVKQLVDAAVTAERKKFCSDLAGLHDVYSLQSKPSFLAVREKDNHERL